MSKKFKILMTVLLAIFCAQGSKLQAQDSYILEGFRNNLAIWLGAGYSRLGHNINQTGDINNHTQPISSGTKISGGYGGLLGIGYYGSYNKFMFGVGVEFNYLNSKTTFSNISQDVSCFYTPMNQDIIFHYNFSKFSDVQNAGYINIPINVGFRFNDLFYAVLGAKYGLNFLGSYSSKGMFSVNADNPQFAINNKETDPTKGSLKFNANIIGSAEFGVCLDKWIYGAPQQRDHYRNYKKRNSYRAGLFIDYGFANILINPTDNLPLIKYPETINGYDNSSVGIKTNSLFNSNDAKGKSVNPMLIGVKLTVLLDVTSDRSASRQVRPRFTAKIVDSETGNGIPANVLLRNAQGQQVGTLVADSKTGIASRLMMTGTYLFDVTLNDYEPYSNNVLLSVMSDTLLVKLVHKPVITVKVIDSETKLPLAADITVSDTGGEQIFTAIADKTTGEISRTVEKGNYIVSATARVYISNSANVTAQGKTTVTVELNPIKP